MAISKVISMRLDHFIHKHATFSFTEILMLLFFIFFLNLSSFLFLFLPSFSQLYWILIDKIVIYCTMWWFDIPIHCERISMVALINMSITSYLPLFVCVFMRTLKFYSKQISVRQYCIINYSHLIHEVLRLHSSYNCKFVFFYQT